jgi:glucoside 3-dehydrogenase (cytochrome c) hitch-hiker subunit
MPMDRREALQRVAWLMGGAISASALLAIRDGYSATPAAGDHKVGFLSATQLATVSVIAEIILPRTDTPGAVDLGVPGFIDRVLKDVYKDDERNRYIHGLAAFDAAAQAEHGGKFVGLDSSQQTALVRKVHDAALGEERAFHRPNETFQRPFILMTKELTLLGFFTSEIGATKVLQYAAVPGAYHGCVPLKQAGEGRTWAFQPGLRF